MKTVQTLATNSLDRLLQIDETGADSIEIINSESVDLDLMVAALTSQAKHGCLGEALRWLYLDDTEHGEALMMKEDRANPDWLQSYSAVYWFATGWGDAEFFSRK